MMPPWLRDLGRGLRQLLYPGECLACNELLPLDRDYYCPTCADTLTTDGHDTCPRCASTVGPFTNTTQGCPSCRGSRFHFERVFRLGPYGGLLRDAILRMKQSSGDVEAAALGQVAATLMSPRLRTFGVSVVMPIPLHWRRRWNRGHNQTEPFAEALAAELGVPCRPSWVRRVRPTPMQTTLTPAGRRENVKGAFAARARPELKGATVLLVDDVMTTGATAGEAARVLHKAGAGQIAVAVLGHG